MALREINIADPAMMQRQFLIRHLTFWGVILLGVLGLIGGYYLYQTRIVLSSRKPTADLSAMQSHIAARIKKIKELQDELNKLEARKKTIETIAKGKPFAAIISKLAESMNDETWLSRLNIKNDNQEGKKIEVILDGFTFTNAKLGEFINKLNRAGIFDGVTLKFANEVGIESGAQKGGLGHKAVQFRILCTVF